MDEKALVQIPSERVLGGLIQVSQAGIREMLQELTPKQTDFIRIRAMTSTDARARHLLGDLNDVQPELPCECGEHKVGWRDFREQTVLEWKKNKPRFMEVYRLLIEEPILFAGAGLQGLAPKAVQAYDDLLEPNVKPAIRRAAAKDVIEATNLKATPGVQGSGDALKDSFAFKMARNRLVRGLSLSDEQRRLLQAGGVETGDSSGLDRGSTSRDLDGNDVVDGEVVRGGDNSEYLPD
jgi:hypothetical protein